jgi:hypothetical protein
MTEAFVTEFKVIVPAFAWNDWGNPQETAVRINGLQIKIFIRIKTADYSTVTLGKTLIAVHQWTAKQFWVDRQYLKQQDNI